MKKIIIIVVGLTICCAAYAEQWHISGPRAMGMGGAFTAVADGPAAQQWNPAGLVQEENINETGVSLSVSAFASATNDLLEVADAINSVYNEVKDTQRKMGTANYVNLADGKALSKSFEALDKLINGKQAVLASVDVPFGIKIKNFAFSVNNYATAGITPVVDTYNIGFQGAGNTLQFNTAAPASNQMAVGVIKDVVSTGNIMVGLNNAFGTSMTADQFANALVYQTEQEMLARGINPAQIDEYVQKYSKEIADALAKGKPFLEDIPAATGSYKDNQTAVLADVGAFSEISLGYGHKFFDGVKVGGNIKAIRGEMARAGYYLFNDDKDVQDVISDAFDETKVSWKPALDLGLLLDINELVPVVHIPFSPKLALSARNINSPKFDRPQSSKFVNNDAYSLDGQYRAGVALKPFNFWTVAADVDLVKNNTILDNYDSQMFALGTEINVVNASAFNLPLRFGVMKNMAETSDYTLTAGLGLNLVHLHIDLAGAYSTGTVTVDDEKIPSQFGASLALSLLF